MSARNSPNLHIAQKNTRPFLGAVIALYFVVSYITAVSSF